MSDGCATYVKFALRKRCWENSLYLLTSRCLSLFWTLVFRVTDPSPPSSSASLQLPPLSVTILIQSNIREEMAPLEFVLCKCSAVCTLVCGCRTEDISSVETNAGRCTFIVDSEIGNSSSCISDGGTDSGKCNIVLSESQ